MLSGKDIARELGKNIMVYPLTAKNIKGACLNLTASQLGWSLKTKKTIFDGNKHVIPPNDTALILTEECLWVSSRIGGTYHSKVKNVSYGTGHIGTILDPEWFGPSLMAIHNHSDVAVEIGYKKSLTSVIFYYLKSEPLLSASNSPSRIGILNELKIDISKEESEWIREEWRTDRKVFLRKFNESPEFNEFRKTHQRSLNDRVSSNRFGQLALGIAILLLFIFGIYKTFPFLLPLLGVPSDSVQWISTLTITSIAVLLSRKLF